VRATSEGVRHLAQSAAVQYIDISKTFEPCLDISRSAINADKVHSGNPAYRGNGVLVAIFDSGIDWRHQDFIDSQGKSRILYLWDMTDDAGPAPSGFTYGSEYTQAQINDEIDGTPAGKVREKDSIGHGTHVAGIAAGDGSATGNGVAAFTYVGIAPEADLIIVKGGDNEFTETNELNGLAYILQKARSLNRPVVINLSFAGHWGAHDGSDLLEQAIDSAAKPGQIIIVAAGNEGAYPIHAGAWVLQDDAEMPLFNVKQGANDIWIDLWHSGNDIMNLEVWPPQGAKTSAVESGTLSNWKYWNTTSGKIGIIAPPKNSQNHDYEITIFLQKNGSTAVEVGEWAFYLRGIKISNGRFDAWTHNSKAEFVTDYEDEILVGIPGTARQAITVASYCTKNSWPGLDGNMHSYSVMPELQAISSFSSPGPTRDNRQKPDIAAPGQGIVSSLSRDASPSQSIITPDGVHQFMQGTSMAAPHVTGAVALLLQKDRTLTPDKIKNIFMKTNLKDSYTGAVWNNSWGYGKLQIDKAMAMVNSSTAVASAQGNSAPSAFRLSNNYPNPFNPVTTLHYDVAEPAQVQIRIVNLNGQLVRVLADGLTASGSYTVQWNGTDQSDQPVASGIYYCVLVTPQGTLQRQLLLLR
jgi:subtilisin family serine protease